MKVKALPFTQEGVRMFNCVIPFGVLDKYARVDEWSMDDDGEEKGYQRRPETARTGKVARYLQKDPQPLLPTSILVSFRGQPQVRDEENGLTELEIPEDESLWVVDGQHRVFGIKRAIEELGLSRLLEYELPVVVVPFAKYEDEAEQFRIINETMKKMRTDLARRLLAMKLKTGDPASRQLLRETGKLWEATAVDVLRYLTEDGESPWRGRIQPPNTRKQASHVIRELSFSTSLKPVLTEYPYKTWRPQQVGALLAAYWAAWRQLVPEAFEQADEHVLLKTPGAFSLHQLAVHVFQVLRARGIPNPSVEDMSAILADLGVYANADFWRADNREGASLAGSMKGFAILADTLIEALMDAGHSEV